MDAEYRRWVVGEVVRLVLWFVLVAARFWFGVLILTVGLVAAPGYIVLGLAELQAAWLGVRNEGSWRDADRGWTAYVLPFLYITSALVSPGMTASLFGQIAAAVVGLALLRVQWVLGRRFTVAATTWVELCDAWPYSLLRHPLIALQLLARGLVCIDAPTVRNLVGLVAFTCCCLVVVMLEERWLLKQEKYCDYCRRVRWRLIPLVW